ncbi:MAG: MFS transporter, partial [Bacteroidota bacterium]|nr:MFS transporter [Bacteroidota bacterium]
MFSKNKPSKRNPWAWIPTLYFAEGIPYVVVMTVAVIMYKRLGISNTDIALYTSWLYLPWVIKPLWSPIVDLLKTKRWWIVVMQLLIGAGLGGVALSIQAPVFFKITLIFFWLLAFSSATHDIAADGFYMLGLEKHEQAYFVGIRSTFYRVAMITGQGLLIILAGFFETSTGLPPIEVKAAAGPTFSQNITLPEINTLPATTNRDFFFTVNPQQTQFSTKNISTEKLDSIKQIVSKHNVTLGFINNNNAAQSEKKAKESSWWSDHVSTPLTDFLKDKFGTHQQVAPAKSLTGNVAIAAIKLSQKPEPGKKMILNLKFKNGDNSIRLVEGERLVFDEKNWDKPAYLLFQADPKLNRNTEASFIGTSGNLQLAWSFTFVILAVLFVIFCFYHKFMLPYPASDHSAASQNKNLFKEFFGTFGSFFKRKNIGLILAFLLLYRLAESQLVKMASPFMLDTRQTGGLGLTTGDVGLLYGTFGIISLTIGGILGGIVAAKKGLKFWLIWMVLIMNVCPLVYVVLSYTQPQSQYL